VEERLSRTSSRCKRAPKDLLAFFSRPAKVAGGTVASTVDARRRSAQRQQSAREPAHTEAEEFATPIKKGSHERQEEFRIPDRAADRELLGPGGLVVEPEVARIARFVEICHQDRQRHQPRAERRDDQTQVLLGNRVEGLVGRGEETVHLATVDQHTLVVFYDANGNEKRRFGKAILEGSPDGSILAACVITRGIGQQPGLPAQGARGARPAKRRAAAEPVEVVDKQAVTDHGVGLERL